MTQPPLPPMHCHSVLARVQVIEVGQLVAVPHRSLLLTAARAGVIKVRLPSAGDDTRQNFGSYPSAMSTYFVRWNLGKRSIVLNHWSTRRPERGGRSRAPCPWWLRGWRRCTAASRSRWYWRNSKRDGQGAGHEP